MKRCGMYHKEGVIKMATAILQVYQCSICGNMVEVIHAAAGSLVCCSRPMDLLVGNTTDAAREKHVPVVEP